MWTNVKPSYQLSYKNHVANQNYVPSKLAIRSYLPLEALHEKHTSETCSHEEWRRVDCTSPSSCLTLQSHQRHVPGRISD
jgi:hypothetical protein